MTTATHDKPNGEGGLTLNARVIRDLRERLRRLSKEDKAAVAELLQVLATEPQEEEEAMKALLEILFPEIVYTDLDADIPDDPTARERVDSYRRKVGREIRKRRLALNMRQEDLALAAGIPQSHVCRLERGKHTPTYVTIEKIARALGTNPSQLDPGFEDPPDPDSP